MHVKPPPAQPGTPVSAIREAQPSSAFQSSRFSQRAHIAAKPLQHEGVLKLGVVTYIVALLLIAAFSVAFHFITDNIVRQQDATARVVNVSGRQRMLSQRIARLALERAAHTQFRPDAETDADLKNAINLMAASHEDLLRDAAPPAVTAVYTGAPYRLDAQIASFLDHARAVAARPATELNVADGDLVAVERAAQTPLLQALNAAVAARQESSEASIKNLRTVLGRLTLVMLAVLLGEALFLYRPWFNRLRLAHEELLDLGRTDPLTGCLNRRAFTQEAQALVEECKATGSGLAVLMTDIDRFKSINDRFGHSAGDDVIHEMVTRMVGKMTSSQRLCRMGGEEFAVLLRGATMAEAAALAEELRRLVAETPFAVRAHEAILELDVTVSFGVAELVASDTSIFTVLGRADKALYRAKHSGRNRLEVEWYEVPAPVVMMGAQG